LKELLLLKFEGCGGRLKLLVLLLPLLKAVFCLKEVEEGLADNDMGLEATKEEKGEGTVMSFDFFGSQFATASGLGLNGSSIIDSTISFITKESVSMGYLHYLLVTALQDYGRCFVVG